MISRDRIIPGPLSSASRYTLGPRPRPLGAPRQLLTADLAASSGVSSKPSIETANTQSRSGPISPGCERVFRESPGLFGRIFEALGGESQRISISSVILEQDSQRALGILLGLFGIP